MQTPSASVSGELRAYLARHRKSIADLAIVVGVSEATIYRRLNEDAPWPLDEAIKAAHWVGVSIDSLVESENRGIRT